MPYKCINLMLLPIAVLVMFPLTGNAFSDDEDEWPVTTTEKQPDEIPKTKNTIVSPVGPYEVQPGDILAVSVWGEPQLQLEVLVRPDGMLSLPLAGEISARNKALTDIRLEITDKLKKYVPDADVTVALKQIQGNKVYVIGKVNRPGEFLLKSNVDVMQALSMAGGATPFADVDEIKVLRRSADNEQKVFEFDYDEIKDGENLDQNIMLKSGDVVVVP